MSQQRTDAVVVPAATATTSLLVLCGVARVVAVLAAGGATSVSWLSVALASLDVVLPFVLAALHVARRPSAPAATLALGALGAGQLMSVGVGALQQTLALDLPTTTQLLAAALAMLAGATVIGRWQDRGAPAPGPGPRPRRAAAVLGALLLGASLITTPVAVVGRISLGDGGQLPGPVALATTVSLGRLPLAVAVLLVTGWAVTRADGRVLRAVALVLAVRALGRLGADLSIQRIEPSPLLLVLSAGAVVLLLVASLVRRDRPQVTSSSA